MDVKTLFPALNLSHHPELQDFLYITLIVLPLCHSPHPPRATPCNLLLSWHTNMDSFREPGIAHLTMTSLMLLLTWCCCHNLLQSPAAHTNLLHLVILSTLRSHL
ncbi:hypothetical protein BDR03DRAFT_948486 [Suillus americanus]|nr:hypothetical protein BDR03DRAFT_948486 [Suillus americanus]